MIKFPRDEWSTTTILPSLSLVVIVVPFGVLLRKKVWERELYGIYFHSAPPDETTDLPSGTSLFYLFTCLRDVDFWLCVEY